MRVQLPWIPLLGTLDIHMTTSGAELPEHDAVPPVVKLQMGPVAVLSAAVLDTIRQ